MSVSLAFLIVTSVYGIITKDMWPSIAAFLIYMADTSVVKPMLKPLNDTHINELKEELSLLKLEVNSIKLRSMK